MPVKLHYQSHGRGKPVLILHGLFGSSRNWSAFARKLAGQYQVITVDLRNHGNSEHTDSMTYTEMAADIRRVLELCGLKRASLIGHSMGGKAAMVFALYHRAMLDKLVVLDITPASYRNNFRTILETLEELPLSELASRKQADKLLAGKINDTSLRLFLLTNLVKTNDGFRWRINITALKANLDAIGSFPALQTVAPYSGPALFLGGGDSGYLRPEHHPAIKQYFTNAKIDYVDNTGHWLHIEQPDTVLSRITAFFQS